MARCPDCNKFVSYDTDQEPEVDVDIDEDGQVTGSIRIFDACSECGTELRETTLDISEDMSEACEGHLAEDATEPPAKFVVQTRGGESKVWKNVANLTPFDSETDAEVALAGLVKAEGIEYRIEPVEGDEGGVEHSLSVEAEEITRDEKKVKGKTVYVVTVKLSVKCDCSPAFEAEATWTDEVAASDLEGLS
jgi:hypothetical protein